MQENSKHEVTIHYLGTRNMDDVMSQPAIIPVGSWPRRMPAALSAGYCGEATVEAFVERVGRGEYPQPRVCEGRRKLWLKDDLDRVIAPDLVPGDVAEDL